ncbi:NAD(P)-binding Rossmann-fold superfamily protein [Striga hermonthica]|uniref:Dihydroflavonol 4-reductase n=1 Tax=Striga hermonthica TaxID=68872 RepID=A0A9N7RDE7_STRHE|nr:NAD(P)-binding Rossmann-fold superfamily protein [Striga hermonthica]
MDSKKGSVCVTGGTGFIGSWIVKMLLEDGYHVNTTSRIDPECKRDISFLTSLPSASERLQIFNADLDKPETFRPAIKGCIGLFHVAHPLDFEETEPEDVKVKRVTKGLQGILQACADAKTIRRVVYTSSITAACVGAKTGPSGLIDERSWTDVEFVRRQRLFGGPYFVTKTLAEKAAIDCADELGLDLVCVLPTTVTGPFICKHIPITVYASMALIFADKLHNKHVKDTSLVHVDDVARAHIHLFEYPNAKGRYICAAVEFTIAELCEFISARYLEYKMPNPEYWMDVKPLKFSGASTKKLEDTGFKYKNGLAEMFDDAIKSCKEKGFL